MKKLTLFLIANSKINKRFRKGEDFIIGECEAEKFRTCHCKA